MATGTTLMAETAAKTDATATASTAEAPTVPAFPPGIATLLCLGAALVSGIALWLCYHPVGWGYLGWIALAPMLVLVRSQTRPSLIYLFAYLGGLIFFLPALSWMSVAHSSMVAAWITLAIYCALYFPLGIWMVRIFDRRRVPLLVSVPLVWIALEFLRCHFLSGYPWYLLAHTQHDCLPMIQITDLGGVFVVSLIVAAGNAIAFDVAYQFPEVRRWFGLSELEPYRYYASIEFLNHGVMSEYLFRRNLIIEGVVLGLLLLSTYAYGRMRLAQDQFFAGPTVCLLQSNIDQRLREGLGGEKDIAKAQQTVREHFAALCVRATKNHHPHPDLIIWPETSFPSAWVDVSPKLPAEQVPNAWRDAALDVQRRLKDFGGQYTQTPHLLGMNAYVLDADAKERHYNMALLLDAKGEVEETFNKIHRVPFGEYIPLKDWFPFLARLSPYEGDFGVTPGDRFTRFKINQHHFGVLICYEDTIPFLARRYMEKTEDGPPVDFLVNISNDGWFDGSAEHEEHLAVSRFRAIECRRAMVRAVNMGVSAVIDSNGRVMKPKLFPDTNPPVWVVEAEGLRVADLDTADWHKFKKTALVLKATVPIDRRTSLYASIGDVLPTGCWAALFVGAAWIVVRRKNQPIPVKV